MDLHDLFFTILFVNYFTEIPIGMQMTLTAIAIIIFGSLMMRYLKAGIVISISIGLFSVIHSN